MLKLEAINKSFKTSKSNEISVLKDVSLSFPNTGLFVVLGPSGSGKTTLLSLLGALNTPDSGSILYNDKDITKFNEKERDVYRQNIVSFVFQDDNLIDYLSLKNNALLKNNNAKDNEVEELLKKLDIDSLKDKKPNTLSGGEKQRCAVARALLSTSQIVLCDEPTASLDYKNAETILEILKEIGKTKLVIAVSHDEHLCRKYTDNIISFKNGVVEPEKPLIEEKEEVVPVSEEPQKVYRSGLFKKAVSHAKHKFKESTLIGVLSLIAFFCVTMIVGLATGTRTMVDNAVNELIHYSPLTVSSYYDDITSISLISESNKTYGVGINIEQKTSITSSLHKNIITDEFVDYLTSNPVKNTYFSFNNDQAYSLIYQEDGSYCLFDSQGTDSLNDYVETFFGKRSPVNELLYDQAYFKEKYHWLDGKFPTNDNEAVLVYSKHNAINQDVATLLNLKEGDDPKSAIGKTIHIADHNALYEASETTIDVTGYFLKDQETLKSEGRDLRSINNYYISYIDNYYEGNVEGQDTAREAINGLFKQEQETRTLKTYRKIQNSTSLRELIDNNHADEITITGIAERKENNFFAEKNTGILINKNLLKTVRDRNAASPIAHEIDNHIVLSDFSDESINIPKLYDYINVLTEHSFSDLETYLLSFIDFFENRKFFNVNNEISSIEIFAPNVKVKNAYIEKINQYNINKDNNEQIKYIDLSNKVVNYFHSYISVTETALYAISIITLIVSAMLSIAIIFSLTMARTKEIGILRACGYSRGYVFTMIEVENVSLGFISGTLGVLLANVVGRLICHALAHSDTDFVFDNLILITPIWSIVIVAIAIITAFVAVLFPIISLSKKKTIDILKG